MNDYSKFYSSEPVITELRYCLEKLDIIESGIHALELTVQHGDQSIDAQIELATSMSYLRSDGRHLIDRAKGLIAVLERMNPDGSNELLTEVAELAKSMLPFFERYIGGDEENS